MTSLKVSNVHKSFGAAARAISVLRGVSFEISGGQNLAVMGPSGSGKSTLLHLIGTLDTPSSGEIEINGVNPLSLPEPELARFRNATIGFVFQDHHLLPQYSVLENVLLPTLAFPDSKRDAVKEAAALLQKVGLSERLHHKPAELSGGESQRVAVARALINQPGILLCDEPTGNLDEDTSLTVSSLLFDLHRDAKNILIVVTHNSELASRFERRFRLIHGQLT